MLIKKLLLMLIRNDSAAACSRITKTSTVPACDGVLDYVEEHLTDRIQVEDVSKLANMSYYYFVKFFKKAIGLSFTEYVNYRKIKWAERILLHEGSQHLGSRRPHRHAEHGAFLQDVQEVQRLLAQAIPEENAGVEPRLNAPPPAARAATLIRTSAS